MSTGIQRQFSRGPVAGTFAAYNSFDGAGPLEFRLEQQVSLPSSVVFAQLNWQHTYNVDYAFVDTATVPREFRVELLDATGTTLLQTLYSQTIEPIDQSVESDWQPQSLDVSGALGPLAGQTVTIAFVNEIPEVFTGPGGFGLDETSLSAFGQTSPIPAVSPGLLLLLIVLTGGLAWAALARRT